MDLAYTVIVESRDRIKTVEILDVDGLEHAIDTLREKYSFDEWRIVNIASTPVSPCQKQ